VSATTKRRHRREPGGDEGVAGNERLTALTGVVLLVGFAIEGVTILRIGRLLTLHFFLGLLLIGPVVLKICSTVYRIARYYTGAAPYVRRGPPAPLLRLLGPFVIATSLAVMATGVTLAITGPNNGPWLFLLTFDGHPSFRLAGGAARWLLVAASLACGLVIALLAVHLAGPWEAARFGH
jgi:hypothetical protein